MRRKILIPFFIFAAILIFPAILIFSAIQSYSSQVAITVKNQAEQIANARPFCIQVAANDRYKPITGFEDILGMKMLGHGGYHHSVLVVGDLSNSPDTYHWSYWKNRFVAGTYGPFPIYCLPSKNYFSTLPSSNHSNRESFSLLGINFSIPNEYHPKPQWPGSFIGLSFLAKAPDFLPANNKCDAHLCYISVDIKKTFELETRLNPKSWSANGEDLNANFGLSMQKEITSSGNNTSVRYRYYLRNSKGIVVTEIYCFESLTISCLHQFESDGWRYSFHHMPKDLKDWLTMERKIVALTKSFIAPPQTP
jgi:hypothetical protein